MNVARFQTFDPSGECQVPSGICVVPEHTSAEQDARGLLGGTPGWRIVLWKDPRHLFGPIASLGKPDAEVTA